MADEYDAAGGAAMPPQARGHLARPGRPPFGALRRRLTAPCRGSSHRAGRA